MVECGRVGRGGGGGGGGEGGIRSTVESLLLLLLKVTLLITVQQKVVGKGHSVRLSGLGWKEIFPRRLESRVVVSFHQNLVSVRPDVQNF